MRRRAHAPRVALGCALLLVSASAHAGGLYLSDRGVRPMGRGGAFVAGADDLGAIAFNPAGLADAKSSVLADFSYLRFSADFTRSLRIVDADGTVRYVSDPTVHGSSPFLPLPTLAASYAFGPRDEFTVAAGAYAPYAAIASYPDTVGGKPSPSRYALGSFDGSALMFTGAYVAWKPNDTWRLGLGVGALVGVLSSTLTFSVSPPDRLLGAPEQPDYDAASGFRVGPIVAPTGSLGGIWKPSRMLRLGASFQLPTVVDASARFNVRLPSSAVFDGARVSGSDARVRFTLPSVLRAGVEVRPIDPLRVEFAYVREFWSVHDSIKLTPEGVALEGVSGLPKSVALPPIAFPRGFQDSNSFRLGGEYTFDSERLPLTIRSGLSYETSAVPPAYLSLLTIDTNKVTLSLGAGLRVSKHWRVDAMVAHLFLSSVVVSPEEAKIPRVNPLPGNATLEGVNGGSYNASADLFGLGANYTF